MPPSVVTSFSMSVVAALTRMILSNKDQTVTKMLRQTKSTAAKQLLVKFLRTSCYFQGHTNPTEPADQ